MMKLYGYLAIALLSGGWLFERDHSLPHTPYSEEDTLPPLPDMPVVVNGWVGRYTYTVKLRGEGNKPKPYSFYAHFFRVHTGFVELTREIRSPILVNQPDKNNAERWESWISSGTKKSWNYVNDTVKAVTVITSDACCRTPHDHSRFITAGDKKNWKEGRTHNYSLQIDHASQTFIFSLPLVTMKAAEHTIWKVNKDAKITNAALRDVDEKEESEFKNYGHFNSADTIMGQLKKGQKEIIIHRSVPMEYTEFLWHENNGNNLHITPVAKGTVEFTLVLKRVTN